MKVKLNIKKQVQLRSDILEEKINKYLRKNFYRVTERGIGYVIFIDDEFSDRRGARSDIHTRIREGKFEFQSNADGTFVKLIYLTPIAVPFFIIMVFVGTGLYVNSLTPVLMSLAFTIPFGYRIYYLNEHVFNEVLEC